MTLPLITSGACRTPAGILSPCASFHSASFCGFGVPLHGGRNIFFFSPPFWRVVKEKWRRSPPGRRLTIDKLPIHFCAPPVPPVPPVPPAPAAASGSSGSCSSRSPKRPFLAKDGGFHYNQVGHSPQSVHWHVADCKNGRHHAPSFSPATKSRAKWPFNHTLQLTR